MKIKVSDADQGRENDDIGDDAAGRTEQFTIAFRADFKIVVSVVSASQEREHAVRAGEQP
jgi:hypothetical protein